MDASVHIPVSCAAERDPDGEVGVDADSEQPTANAEAKRIANNERKEIDTLVQGYRTRQMEPPDASPRTLSRDAVVVAAAAGVVLCSRVGPFAFREQPFSRTSIREHPEQAVIPFVAG